MWVAMNIVNAGASLPLSHILCLSPNLIPCYWKFFPRQHWNKRILHFSCFLPRTLTAKPCQKRCKQLIYCPCSKLNFWVGKEKFEANSEPPICEGFVLAGKTGNHKTVELDHISFKLLDWLGQLLLFQPANKLKKFKPHYKLKWTDIVQGKSEPMTKVSKAFGLWNEETLEDAICLEWTVCQRLLLPYKLQDEPKWAESFSVSLLKN